MCYFRKSNQQRVLLDVKKIGGKIENCEILIKKLNINCTNIVM